MAEWFDEVDPAMVVDQSTDCMAGATDTVFYRGDRIVMRPTTTMLDADVKSAVNVALNGIYGTTGAKWATTVERIEFPLPLSGAPIKPLLSVTLKLALRWGAASRRGTGSRSSPRTRHPVVA